MSDHAQEARDWLGMAANRDSEDLQAPGYLAQAHTHALLAIHEELRGIREALAAKPGPEICGASMEWAGYINVCRLAVGHSGAHMTWDGTQFGSSSDVPGDRCRFLGPQHGDYRDTCTHPRGHEGYHSWQPPAGGPSGTANMVQPRGLYEDIGSPDPSRAKSRSRKLG